MIPNQKLDFWNCEAKINFWATLGAKIQSCQFCLKIGAPSISRMLILNPDSDFLFRQIWAKKVIVVRVVRFNWKLAHMISRGCWTLFQHQFYEFPTLKFFWANLDQNRQSCLFCLRVGIHGIWMMLILFSTFVFLILNWKSLFGQILVKKVKFVRFPWKLTHLVSWGCGCLFQD